MALQKAYHPSLKTSYFETLTKRSTEGFKVPKCLQELCVTSTSAAPAWVPAADRADKQTKLPSLTSFVFRTPYPFTSRSIVASCLPFHTPLGNHASQFEQLWSNLTYILKILCSLIIAYWVFQNLSLSLSQTIPGSRDANPLFRCQSRGA